MASYSFAHLDFTIPSGSHYSPQDPSPNFIPPWRSQSPWPGVVSFVPLGTTTTITESLTIKYFQRVWDIDNSQWCYYTQTAINASPGTTDTQPNNSGNIISSSVVQILEIY
jgi:hypothetical protein